MWEWEGAAGGDRQSTRCGMCSMVENNKAEKGGGFWDRVAVLDHVILPGKVTDLKGTLCTSVGRSCLHQEGPSGWRRGRQGGPGGYSQMGAEGQLPQPCPNWLSLQGGKYRFTEAWCQSCFENRCLIINDSYRLLSI